MPLDVVGQHAQEHVGANPVGEPVVDWPDVQIDRLEAAKRPLHPREGFVRPDRVCVGETVLGQARAHRVEPVEGGFARDLVALSGEDEPVVGNGQIEVLGHLVPAEHGADGHADLGRAAQGLALTRDAGCDPGQVALGGGEEVFALSGALARQIGVAADDQRSPGKSGEVIAAMSRSSNSDICRWPPPTSS